MKWTRAVRLPLPSLNISGSCRASSRAQALLDSTPTNTCMVDHCSPSNRSRCRCKCGVRSVTPWCISRKIFSRSMVHGDQPLARLCTIEMSLAIVTSDRMPHLNRQSSRSQETNTHDRCFRVKSIASHALKSSKSIWRNGGHSSSNGFRSFQVLQGETIRTRTHYWVTHRCMLPAAKQQCGRWQEQTNRTAVNAFVNDTSSLQKTCSMGSISTHK